MADDTGESPFKFIDVRKIQLESVSYDRTKISKLEVQGAIFEATASVQGDRTDDWKEIVCIYIDKSKCFLTLHALQERFKDPGLRQGDSEALKNHEDARPFELWYETGSEARIPTTLVLLSGRRGSYGKELDERQLEEWKKVANKLGGKPPENFSPMYARFLLRPSDALKKKKDLLYCSPAEAPAFGVDKAKLEDVIKTYTGKFNSWPDPVVINFDDAKRMGLRLIGQNFLQLYFTWMKPEYYEELWKQFGVTELLHALPAEGDETPYEDVDTMLKPDRAGPPVDEVPIPIVLNNSESRKATDTIMGKSATFVADKLWGKGYITSGMGGTVKVEWLHRVAHSFRGMQADTFPNLVFGTWECNTDMVRAENCVRKLADKCNNKGKLTTVNKTPGAFSRHNPLQAANTDTTIPTWATNYSWLCFSLEYQYQMGADSPLGQAFVQKINFDPWSIYVPLSMEPRLDYYILQHLSSAGSSTDLATNKIDWDAYQTLAWKAAINGLPSVELPDIVVQNPSVVSPPAPGGLIDDHSNCSIPVDAPVPKGGFLLYGVVDLFRTDIVGNLEKWIGPRPENVFVGTDFSLIERVVIPGEFHLSTLIPLLHGTPFDNIIFRNAAITYQNAVFDKTKSVGWHFNTDWVIDSSCGLLYDILRTALRVDKPILSIHAAFGKSLQWTVPLNVQSLILEGVFPNLTLSPASGLTLTSIGVRLLGIRGFSFTPKPHSTLSYGFGVFGSMKLDVPGSIVPLNLDYEIGLVGKTINLRADISGSIWEDALGVQGLLLRDVTFGTSLSVASPWKTFAFGVSATFSYLSSVAYLQGSYTAGGHFSLTAELDDFGIQELNDLFYTLFGDFLTLPDFDVHIGSAIISIVSGQGLSISLLDVNIAGYTSASLQVSLSSSGASLSGKVSSSTITFGDVELRDALIKLSFWTTDKKKNVELMLGGTLVVEFLNLTISAVVHLYPGKDGVDWAVVAELSSPIRPFSVSDLVPAVKDSFVDFSLSHAVFIAASKDDLLVDQSFPGYHIRKGVQVFGVIDHIQALDYLLREEVKGLVFNASWSKASGFSLFVSLPAAASIDLGNGIKTTPITVGIRTAPPQLAISAGVTIPIKDSTPLTFNFVLAANATEASASAQMDGWWVKPFGVDNLKIGPEVTLSIGIIYVQFVTTGTPSEFGVSGGLAIGSTEAFVAMNVSEDPQRQLLFGELKKLDISDVVTFAGTLLQANIPHIPDNLLRFEELKVYICPFGLVLGQTVYPPGFSFKADLLLLEKRADIECTIDKVQKSVDIIGGIDNLQLGPLTVRGLNGPRAKLECHIGLFKQQLVIDGMVTLLDMDAQTYVNIQFLPEPIFNFHMLLQFAKVFMYELDAELVGSIHNPLSDADFTLRAELDNDILDYIAQQIIEQFKAAEVAADQGIAAAQAKVDEAEKEWEAGIAEAEKNLEDARKAWESYEASVRSANQPIIDWFNSEISRLQGELDRARRAYQDAQDNAQRKVNQAEQDRNSALAAAQDDIEQVQRDMNNAIDDAQGVLDDAEWALSSAFGVAERAIDAAQAEVDELQNEIDDKERTIEEYEDAPFWRVDLKIQIPVLWGEVGVLKGLKFVADLVLDDARAVLQGSEYLLKEGAVESAREELERVRSTWNFTLEGAKTALREIDARTEKAVKEARAALERVKTGAEYYAIEVAQRALDAFKSANTSAYEAAMTAIQGLMNSAQYVAYTSAQALLEVAEGATGMLDAARAALEHVKESVQGILKIAEEVLNYGAKAVNIRSIILSGTLRGMLGIDGRQARPLSAEIKGYIIGKAFDVQADFDIKGPAAAFITAIFKKLWDMIKPDDQPTDTGKKSPPSRSRSLSIPRRKKRRNQNKDWPPYDDSYDPLLVQAGRAKRSDVLRMLAEKSESILVDMPRRPFSGSPVVSSLVVATRAMVLMREEGVSFSNDLGGM